jgi:hypothetical protein
MRASAKRSDRRGLRTGRATEGIMTIAIHKGSCHCGAVTFEVDAPTEPAVRCNCSLCRRKGILMTPPFPEDHLRVITGRDDLTLYQFNTRVAEHYFCRHCGVATFSKTRKDPLYWRANLGCLKDVEPYALDVSVLDGASTTVIGDA